MKRLFSPWRSQYIGSFSEESNKTEECILCKAFEGNNDEDRYIIFRGKHSYVVMNLYPYNSGHLMVVPYRHIGSILDLTDDESLEVMNLIKKMVKSIQTVLHPDGFNVGSNLGRVAGAGIDRHIHFHIVPRWSGDTNFMPILSDTKLISEDMKETWKKLKAIQ